MADCVRAPDPGIFDLDVDELVAEGRYNLADEVRKLVIKEI